MRSTLQLKNDGITFCRGRQQSRFLSFLSAAFLVIAWNRSQAIDLTFFTCSDTHYREVAGSNATQTAIIDMMNALPGKEYPASVGGGKVGVPRGVIVPGDLVDTGQAPPAKVSKQWALWVADFGLKGEGRLHFPVYEGYGNHDLNGNCLVETHLKERTLVRSNIVEIATNGFHYAWEWDGIHFVQLNLYPANTRPKGQPPRYALDFLKKDLEKNVGTSRKPVIISHHYVPTDGWWTDEEKNAYYDVIKDYNVILIIVGHQFRASIIDWKGLTVLDNNDFRGTGTFVVHIKDKEMTIAQRARTDEWKLSKKKAIEFPAPSSKDAKNGAGQ